MTRGIVYYNRGTKCLIRMLVSVYTLRRTGYAGAIALMAEYNIDKKTKTRNDLPDWVRRELKRLDVQIVDIPNDQSVEYALVQKTRLHNWAPYDVCLFIDADTLVLRDPSELLDPIEAKGYGVARFVDWITTGNKISGRIRSWRCIVGDRMTEEALAYGPAVNTGVFGWRRGFKMLAPLQVACEQGYEHQKIDGAPLNRTLDEVAAQMFCPQFDVALFDEVWNWSVQYGLAATDSGKIGIIHYHGGKHLLTDPSHKPHTLWACEQWRQAYWELRNGSPEYDAYGGTHADNNLRKYELPKQRKDLTVVCASDERYTGKLERHLKVWLKTPGLREQQYLLLCVGSPPHVGEFARFNRYQNMTQVYYEPVKGAERREQALSAFIFGVADNVKTDFHMKLDGDAEVKGDFVWPDYTRYTITADRWGSTRNKGAPHLDKHFLVVMDEFWQKRTGEPPIFPTDIPVDARYRHPRIRSYCFIARTDFIRKIADECKPRLPIPSHDGVSWYWATREGLKINRHNFREFINA